MLLSFTCTVIGLLALFQKCETIQKFFYYFRIQQTKSTQTLLFNPVLFSCVISHTTIYKIFFVAVAILRKYTRVREGD